eukprot:TRINITY_DN10507_c0_g1_i1.p1 TRINITY_DN10507_c0_g1~~TRINITY_DN10507_c0_g1_i1.p1  ORF type:complete len:1386 (+),score=391.78 TRINITY_DN10507_c0_g1_i1:467-4159(+)
MTDKDTITKALVEHCPPVIAVICASVNEAYLKHLLQNLPKQDRDMQESLIDTILALPRSLRIEALQVMRAAQDIPPAPFWKEVFRRSDETQQLADDLLAKFADHAKQSSSSGRTLSATSGQLIDLLIEAGYRRQVSFLVAENWRAIPKDAFASVFTDQAFTEGHSKLMVNCFAPKQNRDFQKKLSELSTLLDHLTIEADARIPVPAVVAMLHELYEKATMLYEKKQIYEAFAKHSWPVRHHSETAVHVIDQYLKLHLDHITNLRTVVAGMHDSILQCCSEPVLKAAHLIMSQYDTEDMRKVLTNLLPDNAMLKEGRATLAWKMLEMWYLSSSKLLAQSREKDRKASLEMLVKAKWHTENISAALLFTCVMKVLVETEMYQQGASLSERYRDARRPIDPSCLQLMPSAVPVDMLEVIRSECRANPTHNMLSRSLKKLRFLYCFDPSQGGECVFLKEKIDKTLGEINEYANELALLKADFTWLSKHKLQRADFQPVDSHNVSSERLKHECIQNQKKLTELCGDDDRVMFLRAVFTRTPINKESKIALHFWHKILGEGQVALAYVLHHVRKELKEFVRGDLSGIGEGTNFHFNTHEEVRILSTLSGHGTAIADTIRQALRHLNLTTHKNQILQCLLNVARFAKDDPSIQNIMRNDLSDLYELSTEAIEVLQALLAADNLTLYVRNNLETIEKKDWLQNEIKDVDESSWLLINEFQSVLALLILCCGMETRRKGSLPAFVAELTQMCRPSEHEVNPASAITGCNRDFFALCDLISKGNKASIVMLTRDALETVSAYIKSDGECCYYLNTTDGVTTKSIQTAKGEVLAELQDGHLEEFVRYLEAGIKVKAYGKSEDDLRIADALLTIDSEVHEHEILTRDLRDLGHPVYCRPYTKRWNVRKGYTASTANDKLLEETAQMRDLQTAAVCAYPVLHLLQRRHVTGLLMQNTNNEAHYELHGIVTALGNSNLCEIVNAGEYTRAPRPFPATTDLGKALYAAVNFNLASLQGTPATPRFRALSYTCKEPTEGVLSFANMMRTVDIGRARHPFEIVELVAGMSAAAVQVMVDRIKEYPGGSYIIFGAEQLSSQARFALVQLVHDWRDSEESGAGFGGKVVVDVTLCCDGSVGDFVEAGVAHVSTTAVDQGLPAPKRIEGLRFVIGNRGVGKSRVCQEACTKNGAGEPVVIDLHMPGRELQTLQHFLEAYQVADPPAANVWIDVSEVFLLPDNLLRLNIVR